MVSNMNFIFHFIYGMSSFPLTNSYFSRWFLHHQPALVTRLRMRGVPPWIGTSKLVMCSTKRLWKTMKNKLRWYPEQPQRFIFTNLSEACCEAKRWKRLSWVSVNLMAANPVEPDLALHQSLPEPSPEPSGPFPEPRWTRSGASSAHRSYSGLKTPLAYAAGEKCQQTLAMLPWNMWSLAAT